MTEPRRTPWEAERRAADRPASGRPPKRRTQRPLDSAGRPVRGPGPDGDGARDERPPFADNSLRGAAADWERLRDAAAGGHGGPAPSPEGPPSLASLIAMLEALRGVVPSELERQFSALLREVLLTLRALIDWYLERLDGARDERQVEDIPID
jgi:hypothetical protein